jgi:PII-like signaling protein
LVRIFIGENDRYEGKALYKYIVELCRERGIAGATVFRGIMGYGKSSVIHGHKLLKLSSDLPIVIEIVDCKEKIDKLLPELSGAVKGGLITLERVKVIRYN